MKIHFPLSPRGARSHPSLFRRPHLRLERLRAVRAGPFKTLGAAALLVAGILNATVADVTANAIYVA